MKIAANCINDLALFFHLNKSRGKHRIGTQTHIKRISAATRVWQRFFYHKARDVSFLVLVLVINSIVNELVLPLELVVPFELSVYSQVFVDVSQRRRPKNKRNVSILNAQRILTWQAKKKIVVWDSLREIN